MRKHHDSHKLKEGQTVVIRTRDGKKILGVLIDERDWQVGCPVVEANGVKYGIGYDAEIVK